MQFKNIKFYTLSDGKYVVSFLDAIKHTRVQKTFNEEAEAKEFISKLKAPESKSDLKYLGSASVETAVRIFLEVRPGNYLSKSPKLIRQFLEFFEAYGVQRLSEESLRTFFTYLKNEENLGDRSMLVVKTRLQGFFKFLIENEVLTSSPLLQIKFDRGAPFKRKAMIFSNSRILEFIEMANRLSPGLFYPVFLLIYETAAKTSDILQLQWKDINLKESSLNLSRSTELQTRMFKLSDRVVSSLVRIPRSGSHIFTNLEGQPFKKHTLGRELKRFQRLAGYETKWSLRDLRASYGANFIRNGGNFQELQKIMGHIRPYQTKEIYARITESKSEFSVFEAVQESGDVSLSDFEF